MSYEVSNAIQMNSGNVKNTPRDFDDIRLHYSQTRSSVPPKISNTEFIIQKLNPLLVVDFRLISAFLYV